MRTTVTQQGRPSSSVTSELAGEFCSLPPNWGTPFIGRDCAGMVRPAYIYINKVAEFALDRDERAG
jgi:hypothetical protein